VRALARERGLDLSQISGTGPGGRIVRADVDRLGSGPDLAETTAAAPSRPPSAPAMPAETVTGTAGAEDERVPLSAVRRITAERLTQSVRSPHFYLTAVVDARPLLDLRAQLNEEFQPDGPRLSVTDLWIRACAVGLRAHPQMNASWGGDHIVRRARINIGCAVALEDGLIVPVVPDADRKSAAEIAVEAHELFDRARAGKLTPAQFSGGTFTISNLGMFGIDHFTAVINPPEAAILAVGAAREEPVVRDGQVVPGTTMKLTLSIDHRVLDGASAAAFLRDLVHTLEHPLRVLA
jgi:pyruvate dehydrogenase E2 component (dihydrolipoamide acetyltransferase)